MTLFEHDDEKVDHRLNMLVIVGAVIAAAVVLAAIFVVPDLLRGAGTTQEIERGNQITACRAEQRVDVDAAQTDLEAARDRRDQLTNEGLEAAATDNDARLAEIIAALPASRRDVTVARQHLDEVAGVYADLVRLSGDDPDAFLKVCAAAG